MTENENYLPIISAMKEKRFKDAEGLAVERVRKEPLNGQGWVFLGEALMLQGFKETAAAVFDRAFLMDPEASWAAPVYQFLSKLKNDVPRLDIEMMMQLDAVSVSAALIVKDEARSIARCLEQLQDAVDEIVVLDTGSTDGTPEIAIGYPKVKLYRSTWKDDYAAARNESLKYVTSDWVICVDADEYLFAEDRDAIRHAAALFNLSAKPVALRPGRFHTVQGQVHTDYSELRMFQMNKGLRYWGKAHAQLGGPRGMYDGDLLTGAVRVRFLHDGYEPEIAGLKGKLDSRLAQIRAMLDEDPENPLWWLFAGRETLFAGDEAQAEELLLRADELAAGEPRFGRRLEIWMLLADIYGRRGSMEQARALCLRALEVHPDYPDAHYKLGGIELDRAKAILEEKARQVQRFKERGAKPSIPDLPVVRALREGRYAEAEQLAIALVEQARHMAQHWVFLGEALWRQGFTGIAKRVFERALLLDPTADWWPKLEAEFDKQNQEKDEDAKKDAKEDIQRLLLVKPVKVSAALIVKDEERCIARCVESLRGAVDEIIVLDTGSTDRTMEILESYPEVKLYRTAWQEDFAAARNEALGYVTGDWVLWIDADEYLRPEDRRALKEAAGLLDDIPQPAAYLIGRGDYGQEAVRYAAMRFFAVRHGLRFWGRVHEQVGRGAGEEADRYRLASRALRIRVYHDGYRPDIIESKRKLERNIRLLEKMVKEEPDQPGWRMFLGREMMLSGKLDQAAEHLAEAAERAKFAKGFARGADINRWLLQIHIARAKPYFEAAVAGFHTYRGVVTADHSIKEWRAARAMAELEALIPPPASSAAARRAPQAHS